MQLVAMLVDIIITYSNMRAEKEASALCRAIYDASMQKSPDISSLLFHWIYLVTSYFYACCTKVLSVVHASRPLITRLSMSSTPQTDSFTFFALQIGFLDLFPLFHSLTIILGEVAG